MRTLIRRANAVCSVFRDLISCGPVWASQLGTWGSHRRCVCDAQGECQSKERWVRLGARRREHAGGGVRTSRRRGENRRLARQRA